MEGARRAYSIAMEGARAVRMPIRVVAVALALVAFLTQPELDDLFLQVQPSCHRDAPLYQRRCAATWINLIYVSVARVEDSWYIGLAFHWLHVSLGRLQRFASAPLVAMAEAVLFIMGVPSIITFTLINFVNVIVLAFYHFVLALLLVPWNILSEFFVLIANEASELFSGLFDLLFYGFLIYMGYSAIKTRWNDYSASQDINALMNSLALDEVEKELESTRRYLMNPNSRLRDIPFIKRDLFQHLSELDATLTDGLPDARASKQKYSQQINRILERIQALGY